LDNLRQKYNIAGMSIAILRQGEVMYAGGMGLANIQAQLPATEHTPYNLASCTKPIASVILMQLVEDGKLHLDDSIADILKDFAFPMRIRKEDGEWIQPIGYDSFFREMQQHPVFAEDYKYYNWESNQITVRRHLTHTSQGVPGEKYLYNGDLFALLSFVAEKVSQMSFRSLLIERIFEPFGMTRTVPGKNLAHQERILGERTKYYRADENSQFYEVEVERPMRWPAAFKDMGVELAPSMLINAGDGIVSTVLDLAKFDTALEQGRLISKTSLETMYTPAVSNHGLTLPYGLGWFIQIIGGTRIVWHFGWGGDYTSLIVKVPDEQKTLIILGNSGGLSQGFKLGAEPHPESVLKSPFASSFLRWMTSCLSTK
jgi:CubicO group peptidase (beta-lactamase class C family)